MRSVRVSAHGIDRSRSCVHSTNHVWSNLRSGFTADRLELRSIAAIFLSLSFPEAEDLFRDAAQCRRDLVAQNRVMSCSRPFEFGGYNMFQMIAEERSEKKSVSAFCVPL